MTTIVLNRLAKAKLLLLYHVKIIKSVRSNDKEGAIGKKQLVPTLITKSIS